MATATVEEPPKQKEPEAVQPQKDAPETAVAVSINNDNMYSKGSMDRT